MSESRTRERGKDPLPFLPNRKLEIRFARTNIHAAGCYYVEENQAHDSVTASAQKPPQREPFVDPRTKPFNFNLPRSAPERPV